MRSLLSRILDIRMIWIFLPLWGNFVFLPILMSALVFHPTGTLHRVVRLHVFFGIIFFGYFSFRGLLALPDPELGDAAARISPVLIIALILWFRPPDIRQTINLKLAAVVPIIALGMSLLEQQFVPGQQRAALFSGNPLLLAVSLLPLVHLNCFLAIRSKKWPEKAIHYGGLFASIVIIGGLAGSRGPLATALLSIVIHTVWVSIIGKYDKSGRQSALHICTLFLVVAVSVFVVMTCGPSSERISIFATNMGGSILQDPRIQMWAGAVEAFYQHPVFGYGPQNRWASLAGYLDPVLFAKQASHPHNLLLTFGLSGGFFGILAGLLYIFVPSISAAVSKDFASADKELFFLGAITVFVSGLSNYVLFEGYVAVVTTLTLIGPYYLLVGSKDNKYNWARAS